MAKSNRGLEQIGEGEIGQKKDNMYPHSVKQWNPFVGCRYKCSYCTTSFQTQLKRWGKNNCQDCYDFKPHFHPERLEVYLPQTGYMQFIFACANGDVSFCRDEWFEQILDRIRKDKGRTFLIQSKNPAYFLKWDFPSNVILGTTIETNRDVGFSNAPCASKRYADFLRVDHNPKMVTIEPVMDFDLDTVVEWIKTINPVMVWLGYNSKSRILPEPNPEKFRELYFELGKSGFTVFLKTVI